MGPRYIAGNLPMIGRYLYPLRNRKAAFCRESDYFPGANRIPLDKYPNGKVVVFGLPKSGNTWILSLLRDYLEYDVVHFLKDRSRRGVCMTHKPFSYRIAVRKDISRGIYIMRDLRDQLCSYYHYVKSDYYKELNDPYASFQDFEHFYFEYFLTTLVHRYDWTNHSVSYVSHGVPLIRYEDLFDSPESSFSKLLLRSGIDISEERVKEAVQNNVLEKAKKEGQQLWNEVPATHFRKGGYGNYKEEMPGSVLRDVNDRFGKYLKRWGYKDV